MVKPVKKLKKILLILGITGAVYGGFKYLLPLVVPFLLAYGVALWLRPSVRFVEARTKVTFRGREYRLPAGFIGGVELTLLAGLFCLLLYLVGSRFLSETRLLFDRLPQWLASLDQWLTGVCREAETFLGFRDGYLVGHVREMIVSLGSAFKQSTMPLLMSNSMSEMKKLAGAVVFLIIFFVASVLSLQEMEEMRERRSRSTFHREFSLLGRRLATVVSAWLRTQLVIMSVTAILCILGLFLIGNPYAILFGIGIGILDALPIFGTGTVLIPWGIILLIQKKWGQAMVILGLYVICYFLRQIMEAKIMGGQVGLSALETLASMYVGLQLFGIAGFLLGPIGLILIEDLLELYSESD